MNLSIAILFSTLWVFTTGFANGPSKAEFGIAEPVDAEINVHAENLPGDSIPASSEIGDEDYSNRVVFHGGFDESLRQSLLAVLEAFDVDGIDEIALVRGRIRSSTMLAQPKFSLRTLFGGRNDYRIKVGLHVRGHDDLVPEDLNDDVLAGWFAHELGHIIDYANRSNLEMIWYGIKYVFSPKFKKNVECRADRIAIEHGFCREIVAMKRFILENDDLAKPYKDKINRFYMSVEDALRVPGFECDDGVVVVSY